MGDYAAQLDGLSVVTGGGFTRLEDVVPERGAGAVHGRFGMATFVA